MSNAKLVSASEPNRSPNQYITDIINLKKANTIGINDYRIKHLKSALREWAGNQLDDLFVTGSSKKGTGLKGSSDLDLFLSLKANTTNTLKEIYDSLFTHLTKAGFNVEKRNVAQRILYWGLQIDIVPGKKMPNQTHWHYVYPNRRPNQERIQTNVHNHVNTILNSGRVNEIIALKIWKQINKLDFPSMYLEMYALNALSRKWTGKTYLADNFLFVLEDIAKYFHSTKICDPSNGSNIISNSLYVYEKDAIQAAAQKAINKPYLNKIIY